MNRITFVQGVDGVLEYRGSDEHGETRVRKRNNLDLREKMVLYPQESLEVATPVNETVYFITSKKDLIAKERQNTSECIGQLRTIFIGKKTILFWKIDIPYEWDRLRSS